MPPHRQGHPTPLLPNTSPTTTGGAARIATPAAAHAAVQPLVPPSTARLGRHLECGRLAAPASTRGGGAAGVGGVVVVHLAGLPALRPELGGELVPPVVFLTCGRLYEYV